MEKLFPTDKVRRSSGVRCSATYACVSAACPRPRAGHAACPGRHYKPAAHPTNELSKERVYPNEATRALSFPPPRAQYPRPEFVGADLSKVLLMDALASTSFEHGKRTLYLIEVRPGCRLPSVL